VWNETTELLVTAKQSPRYSSIKDQFAPPTLGGILRRAHFSRGSCADSTNLVRKGTIQRLTKSNDMGKQENVRSGFLLLGALLIATTMLFVFGWLAEEVLEGDTQKFDELVRAAVHRHAAPGLTWLMHGFSFVGSVAVVTTLCLVAIGVLTYLRRTRMAALLAITMAGMAALDVVLKLAFHRPRPIAYFGSTPTTYSFPSGHAMGSICFYGVLAAILAAHASGRRGKWCIWTGAALLIGMIGYSRIYLGVHYPSDVIAGYCAGAVWAGAVGFLNKIHEGGRKDVVDR
jgi:undecaprenyl-diphosphatase